MKLHAGILRSAGIALLLGFAAAPQAQETKTFQIWTSRDAQQGALPIVTAKQGFFQKEGLNVEVKFVSSGSEIPSGMAGGTIQSSLFAATDDARIPDNVADLQLAWTYRFGPAPDGAPATVEGTPLKIGNRVFADKRKAEFDKYMSKIRTEAIIEWKNDELKKAYEQGLTPEAPKAKASQ